MKRLVRNILAFAWVSCCAIISTTHANWDQVGAGQVKYNCDTQMLTISQINSGHVDAKYNYHITQPGVVRVPKFIQCQGVNGNDATAGRVQWVCAIGHYLSVTVPDCGNKICQYESDAVINIHSVDEATSDGREEQITNLLGAGAFYTYRYLGQGTGGPRFGPGHILFTPDECGPTITYPEEGMRLGYAYPTIQGLGKPGALVKVYDGTTYLCEDTVAANETWSCLPNRPFPQGPNTINADQTLAGETSPKTNRNFEVLCQAHELAQQMEGSNALIASGQDIPGPNAATNQAVINLADHGFDPNGADPHIIVSERNYNYNHVDGNTMDASYCGFTKTGKLTFQVTCWASTNSSGGTVRSSFDWIAIQPQADDVVASGQDVVGPNAATNQAVINLADHGFDPDGADPHIIVSERNYNHSSSDGNTMDASYCGFSKQDKLTFKVTCWASTNASGGTVQSSFDWIATQPKAGDVVASGQDIAGPNANSNGAVIDLADYGFDPDGSDPHIIVSERNYNYNSHEGNTMDASYCGFTKTGKLTFQVTCWASTNSSSLGFRSSFDWIAIQPKSYVCKDAAKAVTPKVVAPDQIIQNACLGLTDIELVLGESIPINGEQYRISLNKDNVLLYQGNWWSFENIADFVSGNYWAYLDAYVAGTYTVTCEARYPGIDHIYSAQATFDIDAQNGTKCENLTFNPDVIAKDATTQATCRVQNALEAKRSIVSYKQEDKMACTSDLFHYGMGLSEVINLAKSNCMKGWASVAYTSENIPSYITAGDVKRYNHLQGYSENGEYMNTCIAHAEANYVGLSDEEKEMVPYIGVTSAACGGNNLANTDGMSVHVGSGNGGIPVYVGNSYCSAIEVPTLVYEDRAFDVTCRLDASRGAPTGYQIKVNGAIIKTGSITSGQTEVVETMALRSGTNTVECLIQGPDNVSYVTPSCSTVVTPEIEPAGSCQTGDSVLNATLCSGDDVGVGADIPTIVVNTCSDSRKCEYICNDGYVAFSGGCIERADYGQVSVPSHIRPFEDYPLVMCQGDVGDGFWKYEIYYEAQPYTNPNCSHTSFPFCLPACLDGTYHNDNGTPNDSSDDYCSSIPQGTQPSCSCPSGYNYDSASGNCLSTTTTSNPTITTQVVRQACGAGASSGCTATCPAGTTMVGGGVDWVGTNGTCHMTESRPNGNGWTGSTSATNSATTSCTAAVEAVCATLPSTSTTQVVRQACGAGASSGCTATCPAGTTMVGGGVDWVGTNGTCHMTESRPNGNGWTGSTSATNSATTSCTAAVEAVCATLPSTSTTQVVRQACGAGASSGCTATCPAGTTMVGGGVDWVGTNGTCHMTESRPNGNGWTGSTSATNSATTSCTAAVEAVCVSDTGTTTTTSTANATCTCPSGSTYDATNRTCVGSNTGGGGGTVLGTLIYTSPVYPSGTNGLGIHLHPEKFQTTGTYTVACLTAPTIDSVAATPFADNPSASVVATMIVDADAPHMDRIDRYRDVNGDGVKELDNVDGIAAATDGAGNVLAPQDVDYVCVASDGQPALVGNASDLFQWLFDWPENIVSPIFFGGSSLYPLDKYSSDVQSLIASRVGMHESICLVKIGDGYSTTDEGIDRFCLSESGNCDPSQCVSSANVCCPDNPADEPVFNRPSCIADPYAPGCQMMACCRLTPDAPGCLGCPAGERYCPSSGQCINPSAGEVCGGTNSCNNNGVCEVGESCDCSDCGGENDTCRDGLRCDYNESNPSMSICIGCEEGYRWCAAQNQCIPAGATCSGGEVCNNDGVCSGDESCGCVDCDGRQNHCIEGLVCKHNAANPIQSSCGGGCPQGTRWCSATDTCIQAGQICPGGEVCNNNGVCDGDEGCGCGDCSAQTDHCAGGLICLYDAVRPENSSCQGRPWTQASSEMRRELCSSEPSSALLQCADDDCEHYRIGDQVFSADGSSFYGTDGVGRSGDVADFFESFPDGPKMIGGAMTFGSIRLSGTGPLVPLYIRGANGMVTQRYIYWNTQDTIAPTSSGLRLFEADGDSVNLAAPLWSRHHVVASVDCHDQMNGRDTPFCGCDIEDSVERGGSGFQTQFIDNNDNKAVYTKIITSNETVSITVRDTAGNEAGSWSEVIDFIDMEAPEIAVTSSGEDIAAIDRSVRADAPVLVELSDPISGIEDYEVVVGDPNTALDSINFGTCEDDVAISANRRGSHGTSQTENQGTISTSRAIFVCVRDGAGNVSKKKFTFSGTRLIPYYQGPVKGFSYSGEARVNSKAEYEATLVDRVDDREVSLNENYHHSQADLEICQNTAIEQNIDSVARGRLDPNRGGMLIDDLSGNSFVSTIAGTNQKNSDGIIYYSFGSTGSEVDGNAGKVVEIGGDNTENYTGWNDPEQGPYSEEGSKTYASIGVAGYKTVIIDGGNLYINADMYYENNDSMIVFVVKRGVPSIHGHGQGGNVYVDPTVTNVNGLFFIDGALMNATKTSSGSLEVLSSFNDEDVEQLRRQLLIYGSLASNNTRGGSLRVDSQDSGRISYKITDYVGERGHCPFGTDAYNDAGSGFYNCDIEDAAKYDLEVLRTFNLAYADQPYLLDGGKTPMCGTVAGAGGSPCICADSGREYVPVGGIGTSSVAPSYFSSTTYALSGKRQCFFDDDRKDDRFESTNQLFATYVKFDTRDDKFEFEVLGNTRCR